jgi:HK97 family phage prohead protease
MNIEHRTLVRELRAKEPGAEGSIGVLAGYAAVFNSRSENLGGFFEEIAPGAFDGVLDNDVRALVDHDSGRVLGRSVAKTLRLATDEIGLRYEVDLPDTQEARDLMLLIKRGDVRESSFGFTVAHRGDDWAENEDGQIIRTIHKVQRLYDVSPVAFPAYPAATVAMRSLINRAKRMDTPEPNVTSELRALVATLQARLEAAETRLENHSLMLRLARG